MSTREESTEEHRSEIEKIVEQAFASGQREFDKIYRLAGGADPRLVSDIIIALGAAAPSPIERPDLTPHTTKDFPELPAANPVFGQWWFRQDAATELAVRVAATVSGEDRVAFIGVSTAAHVFSYEHGTAILMDADRDIGRTVRLNSATKSEFVYMDAAQAVPDNLLNSFGACVIDPPWYTDAIQNFLVAAGSVVREDGSIFCSLPPRLTRPNIRADRAALLQWVTKEGFEIVSLEPEKLMYLVPEFESRAFQQLGGFDHKPWRCGDLLHLKAPSSISSSSAAPPARSFVTYSRDPKRFRVFLREGADPRMLGAPIERNPDFESNVSRRQYVQNDLDIWTTQNKGGQVSHPHVIRTALERWSAGGDEEKTIDAMVEDHGIPKAEAQATVNNHAS